MRISRMLPVLLAALILVPLTGCSNNKGKIEGTKWVSREATVKGQKLPAGILKLEFTSDGKFVFSTGGILEQKGSYSLGSGDNVTMDFDQPTDGKQKKHLEKITIEGDLLTMSDSTGTITFDREKAK